VAIATTDIKYRLTTTAGSSGNSTAQGNVNNSLGKYASTTDMTDASLNNLYDNISGDENTAGTVDYRAFAVINNHGTLTWTGPKVWLLSEIAGGASLSIGLDPVGVVAASAVMGTSIGSETSAPAGVTFSAPTTKAAGLSPGDVPAGSGFIVWVKRTAANNAAIDSDGGTFRAEGDTSA